MVSAIRPFIMSHLIKIIIQLTVLCLVVLPMQAQQVMSADGIDHYNKTKRQILDKANLDIFTRLSFLWIQQRLMM